MYDYLRNLKVMGGVHIILLDYNSPSNDVLCIWWNCSFCCPKTHNLLDCNITQRITLLFSLFVKPKNISIQDGVSIFCFLKIFLLSTPNTQTTYLLLLLLSNVARLHTISLAIIKRPKFWPIKWFDKPNFRFSTTTWFSFILLGSHKYFRTQFCNKLCPKTFSMTTL